MKLSHIGIALSCSMLSVVTAQPGHTAEPTYLLRSGEPASCRALVDKVQVIKPRLQKDDPKWAEYKNRCPDLFTKEKWMGAPGEYDDYKLYRADIDNDGRQEDVLYRRFDREAYTTYRDRGTESRRLDGTESVEQLDSVDLQSCRTEKIFGGYARTDLVRANGQTYVRNINERDVGAAMAIYKKKPGSAIQGSYQDAMCVFEKAKKRREERK